MRRENRRFELIKQISLYNNEDFYNRHSEIGVSSIDDDDKWEEPKPLIKFEEMKCEDFDDIEEFGDDDLDAYIESSSAVLVLKKK